MEEEIWKYIPEYEGIYYVSTLGRIKSKKTSKEKILKGYINPYGYVAVSLSGNIKIVHRLVAIVFLNHIPCGFDLVVNHKNFIRSDNRLTNLEIVTTRENTNQKHLKSTSRYTGVFWNKQTKKWQAEIRIKGKKKYLGSSDNEQEASEYYQKALVDLANGIEFIFNKRNTTSSKYKGVSWNNKNKKWIASISINGYRKHIGSFNTEDIAFEKRKEALLNLS